MGYTGVMREATKDWIGRLVGFDTTSDDGNRPLVEDVAAHVRELGLEPVLRPCEDDPDKVNLLVTVPDKTGGTNGGLVISGHADVVPTQGQRWTTDPYQVDERDGRLYGRGTCDMKGYIGAAIASLPTFIEAELTEPVHLALTYDEEIGCGGGRQLVEDFAALGLTPRLCIVGEPTSMRVIAAHKSMTVVRLVLEGIAAHSSLTPNGVNTIEHGARLVSYARGLADSWRADGPFDAAYVVPHTTLSVNMISGGIAQNTVPDRCEITLEFRCIAADDPQDVIDGLRRQAAQVEADMQAEQPSAAVHVEVLSNVPGLDSDPAGPAHRFTTAALRAEGDEDPIKVTYGTEAGLYAEAGIDTIVCGPGDIAQAHTADEYVDIEQIEACERFLEAIATDLSA